MFMATAEQQPRLAVLIDGENISAHYAELLFRKVSALGEATVRRIYGDFGGTAPQGWTKDILAAHGVLAQHCAASKTGKNATDIALVIDAMDVMRAARIDGVVLVSTDGDYTRLALRLRENGLKVYGIGAGQAPEALVKACTKFFVLEKLAQAASKSPAEGRIPSDLGPLVAHALEAGAKGQWVHLGEVGQRLKRLNVRFDPRTYGFKMLSELIESLDRFEVKRTPDNSIYVRHRL